LLCSTTPSFSVMAEPGGRVDIPIIAAHCTLHLCFERAWVDCQIEVHDGGHAM
jgi:hypothetical protein